MSSTNSEECLLIVDRSLAYFAGIFGKDTKGSKRFQQIDHKGSGRPVS